MLQRNEKNKELDRIGIAILRASALREEEIEKVVDDPNVFSSIRRSIRIEESSQQPNRAGGLNFFNARWIAGGLSLATVMIAVLGLASIKYLNKQAAETALVKAPQAATLRLPETAIPEIPAAEPESKPIVTPLRRPYQAEPTVIKTRAPRRTYAEPIVNEESTSRMEFYPLAGASPDTMGEGRIIRVELPRASLVALGANLPPDGGKQMLKTDLLVGQDGIPRAIRLVD
jgi:hypothetical protein